MKSAAEERTEHERLLTELILHEGVPYMIDDATEELWVAVFPMMRVLKVPRRMQRWRFKELEDWGEVRLAQLVGSHAGVVPIVPWPCMPQLCFGGRSREAIKYSVWHNGVMSAISRHGVYRPETGHQPLPGEELDAIENREHCRDMWNNIFPGFGDAIAGKHNEDNPEGD